MEAESRGAIAPDDADLSNSSMRKAILLTTPRRQPQPKKLSRTALQPLGVAEGRRGISATTSGGLSGASATTSGGFARGEDPPPPVADKGVGNYAVPRTPPPQYPRTMKPSSSDGALNGRSRARGGNALAPVVGSHTAANGSESDSEGEKAAKKECVRLRKRLHTQACELQEVKNQLEQTVRQLQEVRVEADELRLKHSNLERLDRRKSSELLDERRKNDELSKQVKEMSANLINLCGSLEGQGAASEGSGLRKRCFKLVQQNTALSVQSRLLRRQKGWAEAKARVLQNEVTRVYLGIHDRVKDDRELGQIFIDEFANRQFPSDEAQVYQLLLPVQSGHTETIIDFLTHITHTSGNDIHGFLQSDRVFNDQIRNDCLSGLSREFYAVWRRYNQLPHILRAVERIVHLSDYLTAFESFSNEITAMLNCGHAKIWVVDRFRQCMWSCVRDGDGARTFTLPLPRGKDSDLAGKGIVSAAYRSQKPVNVIDAREDPRFRPEEAGEAGHAKSVLCVPICRHTKTGKGGQVRVVLQAVNKLLEPQFDPEGDVQVLRLLGKVSMEVLQVCEASSAASMNTKRKEVLLQLLIESTPCEGPAMLLNAVDRGLQETFLSQGSALHVILGQGVLGGRPQGGSTAKLTLDHSQRKIVYVHSDGLKGIIGDVAGSWNQLSVAASQMENSKYDPTVDLAVSEKTVLHTMPLYDTSNSVCIAVIQFCCAEKERTMLSDDGAYHPDNPSHFRLLKNLLTFVQKHLEIIRAQDEYTKQQGEIIEKEQMEAARKASKEGVEIEEDDSEDLDADYTAEMEDDKGKKAMGVRSISSKPQEHVRTHTSSKHI